ncbi:EcsC family protein [bacterium]|nr:EcsC family protein [bacterium]
MASKELPTPSLSAYERRALDEIRAFKSPQAGWFDKAAYALQWPGAKAGDLVMKTPLVGWALQRSFHSLTHLLANAASWSIRHGAVVKDFHEAGFGHIAHVTHVESVPLEEIDKLAGSLRTKYRALAAAEGVGAGMTGIAGLTADIVALTALNLRAVGEYAAYYGFDISDPAERAFAINILTLGAAQNPMARALTLKQMANLAHGATLAQKMDQFKKGLAQDVVERVAKALGRRFTRAKITQLVPVIGAAVGGGFNAFYTGRVCESAYHLYRERYLVRKYGECIAVEADA